MPPFGAKGGMSLPMELPQGLNPELLAQMLGGGMPGKAGMSFPLVEQKEDDDGVDRSRWQVLYPAYLNKKYTAAKGRRVNQAMAVEDPTVQEMKMICDHFSVPAHIEVVGLPPATGSAAVRAKSKKKFHWSSCLVGRAECAYMYVISAVVVD